MYAAVYYDVTRVDGEADIGKFARNMLNAEVDFQC